jgi:TetR/AcrR family transcriptional regulator, cholesterol catabolism regulator
MSIAAAADPVSTRSNNRYAEIISTAARLFRERGYSGTTVRDLGKAVGVTSGSLFHHFGTKEEILLRVVDAGIQQAMELIARKRSLERDPRSRMAAMIRAHLSALLEGSAETKSVMFYEWWSLSDPARLELIKRRDAYEALWDAAIDEIEGKTLKPAKRRLKRLLLIGAMNWATQWYRPTGSLSIDDITDMLMGAYFSGEPLENPTSARAPRQSSRAAPKDSRVRPRR